MASNQQARHARGTHETADEPAVLVVGAGPTGLLLAGGLARHGVACRVIDEARERQTSPRAITVHARTREVFDDLGIVDEALAAGRRVHGVNLYATQEVGRSADRVGYLGLEELESPYPFMLGIPQPETERVLEGFVECGGARVERPVRLVGLDQADEGVTAQLEHLDSGRPETTRFAYVVGCDGAHSTVRDAIGVPFEGEPYEQVVGLIDMRLDWARTEDEGHVFLGPGGDAEFHPMPGEGRWRLAVTLAPLPEGQPRPEPTLTAFQAMANERGAPDAVLRDPTWMSYFHFARRIVPRYRVGRVFLAGDAAHVHSATGAQGMNTGMQDAYNLAWKLALVVRGTGRPALPDSYQAERRPIAEGVLRRTDLAIRVMTLRSPVGREIRNRLAGVLMGLELLQPRMARVFSGIGLDYRGSPVVAEDRGPVRVLAGDASEELPGVGAWLDFGRGPAPGERAPDVEFGPPRRRRRLYEVLRGTRSVLFLFDGLASTAEGYAKLGHTAREVDARHGDHVAVHLVAPHTEAPRALHRRRSVLLDPDHALHTRFGAGAECLYLVRPDGYVGYRAQPADATLLARYLDHIFL